jgi:hypothetical protein
MQGLYGLQRGQACIGGLRFVKAPQAVQYESHDGQSPDMVRVQGQSGAALGFGSACVAPFEQSGGERRGFVGACGLRWHGVTNDTRNKKKGRAEVRAALSC